MTAAFDQVRALIPRLAPEERTKLKLLLVKHAGGHAVLSKPTSIDHDWLLTGTFHELKRRGQLNRAPPIEAIRRLAPNYETNSTGVRTHLEFELERALKVSPTYTQLLTLGNISAEALARYFEPRMPIALKPMLNVVERTAEALESSFPGYLRSGMLHKLLGVR